VKQTPELSNDEGKDAISHSEFRGVNTNEDEYMGDHEDSEMDEGG